MVVLHIAALNNEPTAGVDVAVPQHIKAQSASEQTALININNIHVDGVENQFPYQKGFRLDTLPKPFCKPDLAVFHGTYYIGFIGIAGELKGNNVPYVIVPHGALARTAQHKKFLKKTAANLLIFNRFFKAARGIQFLSECEMAASKYGEKGFIGSNGIRMPGVKATGSKNDEIKMVYIGRPEVHIKGLDMMIQAVDMNRSLFEDKNIKLHLYGPDYRGGHSQLKELISRYNVERFVFLHGAVVGEEKKKVLQDTDIFIQTSRSEGMSMGILEALSYGIPCILTTGTGMTEIIEKYDAGWAADTDVSGIACAMKKAAADRDERKAKAAHAVELIEENYSWKKTAQDALDAYRKLI